MFFNKSLFTLVLAILSGTFFLGCNNDGNKIAKEATVDYQTGDFGCDCSQLSVLMNAFGDPIEETMHIMHLGEKRYSGACHIKQFDGKSNKEYREYKDGLLDGKWITWHKNGQIKQNQTFVKGLEHGSYIEYNEHGNLISMVKFEEGMPYGVNYFYKEKFLSNPAGWVFFSIDLKKYKVGDIDYVNYQTMGRHLEDVNVGLSLKPSVAYDGKYQLGCVNDFINESVMENISDEKMKAFVDTIDAVLGRNKSKAQIYSINVSKDTRVEETLSSAEQPYFNSKFNGATSLESSPQHLKLYKLIGQAKYISFTPKISQYIKFVETGKKPEVSSSDDEGEYEFSEY